MHLQRLPPPGSEAEYKARLERQRKDREQLEAHHKRIEKEQRERYEQAQRETIRKIR
jgi:hypothetical protein